MQIIFKKYVIYYSIRKPFTSSVGFAFFVGFYLVEDSKH